MWALRAPLPGDPSDAGASPPPADPLTARPRWARLLAAKDVAGAAELEVGQGVLEPGPELRRVEDRLEPFPGLLAHSLAAAIQEISVGAPR